MLLVFLQNRLKKEHRTAVLFLFGMQSLSLAPNCDLAEFDRSFHPISVPAVFSTDSLLASDQDPAIPDSLVSRHIGAKTLPYDIRNGAFYYGSVMHTDSFTIRIYRHSLAVQGEDIRLELAVYRPGDCRPVDRITLGRNAQSEHSETLIEASLDANFQVHQTVEIYRKTESEKMMLESRNSHFRVTSQGFIIISGSREEATEW